jgi:sigma-B regulation protein RsbU (phosphoserine phosphatase)
MPGDVLLLYTDGVTEAINEEVEEFGLARLKTAVSATLSTDPDASPETLIDAILGAVRAFTGDADQYDDITLLVVRRDSA